MSESFKRVGEEMVAEKIAEIFEKEVPPQNHSTKQSQRDELMRATDKSISQALAKSFTVNLEESTPAPGQPPSQPLQQISEESPQKSSYQQPFVMPPVQVVQQPGVSAQEISAIVQSTIAAEMKKNVSFLNQER